MVEPFENSRHHLYAELARIDLLVQREIWRWRQTGSPQPDSGDEFRGLYVSDAEVDAILSGIYPGSAEVQRQVVEEPTEHAFRQALAQVGAEIAARKAASLERGLPLRLDQLRTSFGLTPFDLDALLIGLAPELDLRYERLYAYLQDDVTRKRPGVALILNLLCETPDGRVDARRRFAPDAPLSRHQLIALFGDPGQPYPPLLAQYVKPDPRVIDLLLSNDHEQGRLDLDSRLRDLCDLSRPDRSPESLQLPEDVKAEVVRLTPYPSPLTLLTGDGEASKLSVAEAACTLWGHALLVVHLTRVLSSGQDLARTLQLAVREAYIQGAAAYWEGYDALFPEVGLDDPEHLLRLDTVHATMSRYPVANFIPVGDPDRQPSPALLQAPRLVRLGLPRPAYPLRRTLWRHTLAAHRLAPGADIDAVAGRFRLTDDQIQDAALDAHHRAAQRDPDEEALTSADLFAAARARTSDQLIHLAKKIEPRHTWDDLVLPGDQITQLHELCDQMRYRPIVLGEWGFDRKLSLGKGLNALFAGPSGTGKTMAAEVIAHDLGLDLYKIDLSTVVSKYIGETEKNMERIFSAARNSNAILFFDEADALFGKRSEVRDAHDRYANVEISYLLQKMEEYDGLVMLTSNLNKNMDEAFVRRMHFTIEFPYPEEDARRRIWRISIPSEAPVAPEVDFDLLAERYRLTGGNIRNVVLTAAFLAARDGGMIGMEHLLWATRREYQKMGRLADEREFELR